MLYILLCMTRRSTVTYGSLAMPVGNEVFQGPDIDSYSEISKIRATDMTENTACVLRSAAQFTVSPPYQKAAARMM